MLGWMGLTLIVGQHLGREQAGWRELVPRLALGLVAAASSLWWCALVIDVAHGVSGYVAASLNVTPGDLLRTAMDTLLTSVQAGSAGMALLVALLYMVYGFFVLYVLLQLVLRIALIDLLLAVAPIALGLWILPHTAGWGRHWLRLFLVTVFQQAVQLIALALGVGFLNEFAAIAAFEARPGPGLEAPPCLGLHLHGEPRALAPGQRQHLRPLASDPSLRPQPAGHPDALGPDHRPHGGGRHGRPSRPGCRVHGRRGGDIGGRQGRPLRRRPRLVRRGRRLRAAEQRRVAQGPLRRARHGPVVDQDTSERAENSTQRAKEDVTWSS